MPNPTVTVTITDPDSGIVLEHFTCAWEDYSQAYQIPQTPTDLADYIRSRLNFWYATEVCKNA